MIEYVNAIARLWWDWTAAMFWQVGLLIVLIACIDRLIRRWAWPQLRYALWSLILVKLVLPPTLSLPSGMVPQLRPVVEQAARWMDSEKSIAAESSVLRALHENAASVVVMEPAPPVRAGFAMVESRGSVEGKGLHDGAVADTKPVGANDYSPLPVAMPWNPQSEIRSPQLSWQFYAMAMWLAGTLILGTWLLRRLHSLVGRHTNRAAETSLPQSFYSHLAGCAERLGLRQIPRVIVVGQLATPAVFGVFRPVLLMPKGYLSKLSRRDTEHMLLHELAHIRRGDLHAHGLYMLLQIVYWYNPLLWLARRQLHHLRELSCDATVANLLREQTSAYRQTLLETARRFLARSTEPGLGLLGLFEDANRLVVRLDWLAKPTWRYRTMKRAFVLAVVALMFACVLPMAQGQDSTPAVVEDKSINQIEEETPSPQDLAELQARLEKLEIERQKLQKELQTLEQARRKALEAQAQSVEAGKEAEKAKAKADKARRMTTYTVQPGDTLWAIAEKSYGDDQSDPSENIARIVEANQLDEDQLRVGQRLVIPPSQEEVSHWPHGAANEQWATEMQAWAEQMQQWQQSPEMQNWQKSVEQWQNSDEWKQWQQDMQKWGKEYGDVFGKGHGGADAPADVPPVRPMPPMPAMPAMPAMPPAPAAPHPMPHPMPMPVLPAMPPVHMPAMPEIHVPDMPPVNVNVQHDDSRAKAEETMRFTPPLVDGGLLIVENRVGAINVRGGSTNECRIEIKVTARAETEEEAQAMAKAVKMKVDNSDSRFFIKPVKPDDSDWSNLDVAFEITVPRKVNLQLSTDVGAVLLRDVQGQIKVRANVGAIKTEGVRGNVELETNVGNIDFVAPDDLSAMVTALTNMGSIRSDLPIQVGSKAQAGEGHPQISMGSTAVGTLGAGEGTVRLKSNVGSISIRSKAPATNP